MPGTRKSLQNRKHGELELLLLDALWSSKTPLTSQEILRAVSPKGDIALTTVLTVLSRLSDKNLVKREQGEGRSLLFSPVQKREQHTADLLLSIVSESSNPALAFSYFAEGLSASQLKSLRKSLEK